MQIPIISSSILICLVLLIRCSFRNKVRAVWIYGLWGLVALRLLVPVQFFSLPTGSVPFFREEGNSSIDNPETVKPGDIPVYDTNVREETERDVEQELQLTKPEEVSISEEISKNEETKTQSENIQVEEKRRISDTKIQIIGWKSRAKSIMFFIWFLVAVMMFLVTLVTNLHMSWKLRKDREVLHNKVRPCVYLTRYVSIPCLYGLFHPSVYLTKEVAEQEEEDRSYIILHEYMHYRHLDHIWAGVRLLLICLYWFHPLVWIATKLSRQDAEYAADEAVTGKMGSDERMRYGKMILFTMGRGNGKKKDLSMASAASSSRKDLEKRLKRIARKEKSSVVSAVLLILAALAVTACSFAGKQEEMTGSPSNGGRIEGISGSSVSGSSISESDATEKTETAQREKESLEKAVTETIKQEFSGEMETSSSWQYHGGKYENIVEAHTTIAKTEKENEVTVYLAYMVGAYGIGAPENKPEKCYELRGGERRFAAITFEKEDEKYVLKEYWRPKGGGKLKKDLREKFPVSVRDKELNEYRYYHYLTAECHRQALEFLKGSETGGQPSDRAEISKIKASDVEFVEISTGRGQTVRIFNEKASGFVKKLVSAYNKMKLVPVTNIGENSLDVEQSVTLNFFTRESSHPVQVIFDGKKVCWINGEPKAWVMDEQYFDYNEIIEKAESQQRYERVENAGSRKIQDPYGGPLRLVSDYGSEKKLYRSLLSDNMTIPLQLVKSRAEAMSSEKGIGYFDEYQFQLYQFITIKKMHLLAQDLGIALDWRGTEKMIEASGITAEKRKAIRTFCKSYGITEDEYKDFSRLRLQLTYFDNEQYMGIRNLKDAELQEAFEKDLEKYEVRVPEG